jgi:hypothetical protein
VTAGTFELWDEKGIRVITKLPNSEQSYKGKVINKQTKPVNNRKTVKTAITLTWYRHF